MIRPYFVIFELFIVTTMISCNNFPFKHDLLTGPFPYNFQKVKDFILNGVLIDWNQDGREECLVIANAQVNSSKAPSQLRICDSNLGLIEEVNFNGWLLRPYIFDWTEDGFNDIAVPFMRNDTLFLRLLDAHGAILKEAPLFSGKARRDSSGVFPWTGNVHKIYYEDLEGDGIKELIVFPAEGHAQAPRGVFVYEGLSLKLRWKYEVGPMINPEPLILDYNSDGLLEILIPTSSTCNGNRANGTDDEHCYLFLINHQGHLIWRREFGGRYTGVNARYTDIDGDGKKDLVVLYHGWAGAETLPHLEIIHPVNGQTLQERSFPILSADWSIVQSDRQVEKEFVVADETGKIWLLDSQFNQIRSTKFNNFIGGVVSCEDLDGDGLEEIFIETSDGTFCLDNDLTIKARSPKWLGNSLAGPQLYHRPAALPLLAMFDEKEGALVSLTRNPH